MLSTLLNYLIRTVNILGIWIINELHFYPKVPLVATFAVDLQKRENKKKRCPGSAFQRVTCILITCLPWPRCRGFKAKQKLSTVFTESDNMHFLQPFSFIPHCPQLKCSCCMWLEGKHFPISCKNYMEFRPLMDQKSTLSFLL